MDVTVQVPISIVTNYKEFSLVQADVAFRLFLVKIALSYFV